MVRFLTAELDFNLFFVMHRAFFLNVIITIRALIFISISLFTVSPVYILGCKWLSVWCLSVSYPSLLRLTGRVQHCVMIPYIGLLCKACSAHKSSLWQHCVYSTTVAPAILQ